MSVEVESVEVESVATESAESLNRLHGLLGELGAVLNDVFGVAPSTIDDDALVMALTAMPVLQARFDGVQNRLIEIASERGLAARRGARKLEHLLTASTAASGFDVRARVRRAQWLIAFPHFAAAHEAGSMTTEHLEKIRKSVHNNRTHLDLRRDQQLFVDAARDCSFADFERVCDYWKLAADPDGAEPKDQVAQTSLRAWRRSDGMVKVDGLLDPLSGQVLMTAWEAEVQKLAIADDETGNERSRGKRGAEALLRLVARGAARADGSHPNPLIHIVMSQQVAAATLERFAFGADVPVETDPFDVDGRCELIDGTPIHPRLALAVLGIAVLQRAVMDAKNRPLDVSYPSRGFPKWLKHILALRSRGRCETDGCDAPYGWLQADHDLAHSRGGLTRYDNANLLCRADNLAKGNQ